MPAESSAAAPLGNAYIELLRGLANTAARYRGDSGDGRLADLLAVLAAPESKLLEGLRSQLTSPADRLALAAVVERFAKGQSAFHEGLLRRYPNLFHSQGAD